eukprot:CAMPEP_0119050314 /NCGR_PEP_ID=MMETSP1177-20130426/69166_1 /TAXON_ID=2985 /ORGANISM="Ochromonas sp, Strain CCMP1899" /LENGTH=148 /DNA_ID=CAMNT_0007028563 /DNA_START=223 /DNA_END=670 /DNA_ORIENTATION=+
MDVFIQLLLEPWDHIRRIWRNHMHYLFHEYCSCFKVTQEAHFSGDQNIKEKNATLVEISKITSKEWMRRPLHNFSSTSSPSSGSTRHSSISGDIKSTQGGITTYDNDEDEKDLGNNGQIGLLLDRRGKQEKALAAAASETHRKVRYAN